MRLLFYLRKPYQRFHYRSHVKGGNRRMAEKHPLKCLSRYRRFCFLSLHSSQLIQDGLFRRKYL